MPPKRSAAPVSSSSSAKRRRASSTLSPPPELEPETQPEPYPRVAGFDEYRVNLPKGDVLYIPDFVSESESKGWYEALDALPTWHHPTLRVYNRDVTQSRAVAVYATCPRDMSYSGANIPTHTPLPPFLDRIRVLIQERLGEEFSTVMLNRYDNGEVYIGRHSDTRENRIIASLSLGAERTFVLTPRMPPREAGLSVDNKTLEGRGNVRFTMADRSLVVMQGHTQDFWKVGWDAQ